MATAEELFHRYFAGLYPADEDLATLRAEDANPGKNPDISARIRDTADVFVQLAPQVLGEPALALDYSDASVHRLGAALKAERVQRWKAEADTWTERLGPPPALIAMATHGALYVGECVRVRHGGVWQVRRPLWESMVRLKSAAGEGDLPVFHWWLKALAAAEEDGGTRGGTLGDRYRTHVEMPTLDAEALPVWLKGAGDAADRVIPRLKKVRYDTLHRHLKAHVPELKSVGEDFPSAARVEEMEFGWLDFLVVGGGRMLLVHGPGRGGIHFFWLDQGGFRNGVFVPATTTEYEVHQRDGKLRVEDGTTVETEWLWWGV